MRRRWKFALWLVGSAIFIFLAVLIVVAVAVSRNARRWAEEALTRQYNSKVELGAFRVSIPFPMVQCEGENLILRFQGREDLPPLIAVTRFTVRTSLTGLLRAPHRISFLKLEGLQINVPPRSAQNGNSPYKNLKGKIRSVYIDEIFSENAVLRVLTDKPGKDPLEFDINKLRLNSAGNDGALDFVASLSNPRPPGDIVSNGTFGPWNPERPSLTLVSGNYTFQNADLGVFPGIAGILSSQGNYQGVLEQIEVDGTTDTPDFRVTRSGHPMDLSTKFHAMVDGTDGDTYLQPVEAHIGKTILIAQGSVEGTKGIKGKTVTLDVSSTGAHIEDLLALSMGPPPSMTGDIHLKTKMVLKPGPKDVADRLNLDGSFELGSAHFTSGPMQQKIDNLSKRSEGKPNEVVRPEDATKADDVATSMNGKFVLRTGILTLTLLHFAVPGADVHLDGTYALDEQTMDLHGKVVLQAKLSQTTTGVKSFFLKLADPIFAKAGGGAVLPIRITGPAQHPHYGLELRRKASDSQESR